MMFQRQRKAQRQLQTKEQETFSFATASAGLRPAQTHLKLTACPNAENMKTESSE